EVYRQLHRSGDVHGADDVAARGMYDITDLVPARRPLRVGLVDALRRDPVHVAAVKRDQPDIEVVAALCGEDDLPPLERDVEALDRRKRRGQTPLPVVEPARAGVDFRGFRLLGAGDAGAEVGDPSGLWNSPPAFGDGLESGDAGGRQKEAQ